MDNLKYFFSYETDIPADVGYSFFDVTHFMWMLASLILIALIVYFYKKTKLKNRRTFMIAVAIILLICEAIRNGWIIWVGEYSLAKSLPLQLSRILLFIESMAIITNNRYLKEFSYACGLFSIAAFLAPNIMQYPLIHIDTIRYSISHILILSVPLMWIIGDGFKPDIRYLPKCALLLFGIAGVATAANFAFGGNYLHIHYIPEHVNITLGQPWYALALLGVVLGFWVLTYLPWIIYQKVQSKRMVEK